MVTHSNCGICLDEFTDSLKPIIFSNLINCNNNCDCKCKMEYHNECLTEWIKHKNIIQCPICKISIYKKYYRNDYIEIFLSNICNLIDNYIYEPMMEISINKPFFTVIMLLVFMVVSFVFTILILCPSAFIKFVLLKHYY